MPVEMSRAQTQTMGRQLAPPSPPPLAELMAELMALGGGAGAGLRALPVRLKT